VRILHILDHSVPLHSGYAFRTLAILAQQRALGWTTAQITSAKHTGATAVEEVVDGFTFHRTLPSGSVLERLPVLDQLAVIKGLTRRLLEVIGEVQPEILHAHSPSLNGLAALIAGRRRRLPVVYEVRALWEDGAVDHGTSQAGSWRYRASRALETLVLRRADAVTTICEGLREEIAARGVPRRAIAVIPNGVDTGQFTAGGPPDRVLTRSLGLDGARVLGFIGSFYAYEGLSMLLQALPRVLERAPDVRVLLVGGGFEEGALRRQARASGAGDRVVFAGRVPHERIGAYYSVMEALVYPRRRSRLTELVTPLKPLEAMAQGRLVVASDVGGHKELIRHGETGLLFRADDPESLAATVTGALERPDRLAAIRAAARRFVETERTWTTSVRRYAPVYQSLVAARYPGRRPALVS
jgi:PEP-CTERM/exosortase A-associated glycosyltransferase